MTQYPSMAIPPRLPLVAMPANRNDSTNKDARLVNCYVETSQINEGEFWLYKRPGVEEYDDPAPADTSGDGLYKWNDDLYAVFGTVLYRNGVSVATGLDDQGGVYAFDQILGATPKLVLGNGYKAYAYTVAGGLTASLSSIDVDFPATFVKGWAYLSGSLYVFTSAAVIWGSAINAVTAADSWNPLDFVSANIEPDAGVALSKQLVYVVAFGEWSTEVFFYAGNPTGSALQSQPGAKMGYGCANADSVQKIDDKILWLAITKAGAPQIAAMEGLNSGIISTKALDRILKVMNISLVYSWQVKLNGHSFYVITFPLSNQTWAYDITEDLWSQWTDPSGNYLPYTASAVNADNEVILQHYQNGKLYKMDNDLYTDNGSAITVDIFTPNFDAGSARSKQLSCLTFIADQQPGSTLMVQCSDDDYQTWSNYRKVYLSRKRPSLNNCGSFVKRAYHMRHTSNTALRIQAIEMQYDVGTL